MLSTFNKSFAPTLGEYTFTLNVLFTVKSIGAAKVNKLPAHTCPALLIILATVALVFIPPTCGFAIFVAAPPSKSVNV